MLPPQLVAWQVKLQAGQTGLPTRAEPSTVVVTNLPSCSVACMKVSCPDLELASIHRPVEDAQRRRPCRVHSCLVTRQDLCACRLWCAVAAVWLWSRRELATKGSLSAVDDGEASAWARQVFDVSHQTNASSVVFYSSPVHHLEGGLSVACSRKVATVGRAPK